MYLYNTLYTGVGAISQAAACEGRLTCIICVNYRCLCFINGQQFTMSLANYHLNVIIYLPFTASFCIWCNSCCNSDLLLLYTLYVSGSFIMLLQIHPAVVSTCMHISISVQYRARMLQWAHWHRPTAAISYSNSDYSNYINEVGR